MTETERMIIELESQGLEYTGEEHYSEELDASLPVFTMMDEERYQHYGRKCTISSFKQTYGRNPENALEILTWSNGEQRIRETKPETLDRWISEYNELVNNQWGEMMIIEED